MTDYRYRHDGACRCGALRIHYYCDEAPDAMRPRACQCSYCQPRGASYLSAPGSRLEVQVRDRRMVYAHLFETQTAEFMHCARCNELVYVRCTIDGRSYGLVVASALLSPPASASQRPVDHGGETLAQRLERRMANWIPDIVTIEDA